MPVQTAFEQRGHVAPWTSFEDEASYITDLMDAVPGIRQEQAGSDAAGNPMWVYKIGSGDTHLFFLAQIHGNEPSGRDALLTRMRTWSTSTDPRIVSLLERATILVIPTGNPSSLSRRENPSGVNVNRDYVNVTQPETSAVHWVMRAYQPVLAVDIHEGRNITNQYATHLVMNPNTSDRIRDLSGDLEQATREAVEDAGFTWEPYQNHNITGPEYASNMFGLRGAVGLLLESRRFDGVDADTGDRYFSQLAAIDAIINWSIVHLDDVMSAAARARYDAVSRNEPVELITGTSTSGPVLATPLPDGYYVTDESAISAAAEAYGTWVETPEGVRVLSAGHSDRVLVHYLLDELSSLNTVESARYFGQGEPLPDTPPVDIPVGAGLYYRDGDVNRLVIPEGRRRMYRGWGTSPNTPADPGSLLTVDDIQDFRDNGFSSPQWQATSGGGEGWTTILNQAGHPILIRYTAANHTGDTTSRLGFRRRGQGVLVTPGDRISVELSGWTSADARGELSIQARFHDVDGSYVHRGHVGSIDGNTASFEYTVPESVGMCYMTLEFTATPEASGNAHWWIDRFHRTPAVSIPDDQDPDFEQRIDFGDYQSGQLPSGWSWPWVEASAQVVDYPPASGGKLLRVNGGSDSRSLLVYDGWYGTDGDTIEVVVRWRAISSDATPRVVFDASGSDGYETGRAVGQNATFRTVTIDSYDAGDVTFSRRGITGAAPVVVGEWTLLRAVYEPQNLIGASIWPESSTEPEDLMVEANVTTERIGLGLGVMVFSGEVEIDWIEVNIT